MRGILDSVRSDYRYAPAGAQAQVLAKELVALQPDVILAVATPIVAALQRRLVNCLSKSWQ